MEPTSTVPPAAPERQRRKHVPFLAASATSLLLIAVFGALLFVHRDDPRSVKRLYQPLLAGAISLYVLALVVYLAARGGLGWKLGLPLLLITWLGIERFATPHLAIGLQMRDYLALQDPDHRPQRTSRKQGWNSDSLRCPHEARAFTKSDLNIVFLGDSFTYGMKLEPEQCFPAGVERRLRKKFPEADIKVANFGWTSSSPILSWRRLVDIGDKYSPDLVVMCVDMTDLRDDIRWSQMLAGKGLFAFYDTIPITMQALRSAWPWMFWKVYQVANPDLPRARYFMSEAPLEETRQYGATIIDSLNKIDAWCLERGAAFMVIVLPRTYQYSDRESPENWEARHYTVLGPHSLEPFRFFEELALEVDYPIHSLLDTFRDTDIFPTSFSDDPHWNPAGADLAAGAITRLLRKSVRERLATK